MNASESIRPARTVPDFRGLDFHSAMQLAGRSELKPADPDPDAPPISSRWWNTPLVVATQHPEPGVQLLQWDSVAVTLAPPGAPITARDRARPGPVRD